MTPTSAPNPLSQFIFNLVTVPAPLRLAVAMLIAMVVVGITSLQTAHVDFTRTSTVELTLPAASAGFKQRFSSGMVERNLAHTFRVRVNNTRPTAETLHLYSNLITALHDVTVIEPDGRTRKGLFEKTCLDWFMPDRSAVAVSVPANSSLDLEVRASSPLRNLLRVTVVDETAFQRMQMVTGLTVGLLVMIIVLSIVFALESWSLMGQRTGVFLVMTTVLNSALVLLFLTDDQLAGTLSIGAMLPHLFVVLEYSSSALSLVLVAASTPPKFVRTGAMAIVALPALYFALALSMPDRMSGIALVFILSATLYRMLGMLRQTMVSPEGFVLLLTEIFNFLQFVALALFLFGFNDSGLLVSAMVTAAVMRIINVKWAHNQRLIRRLHSQNMQDALQTLRIRRGGEQKLMDTRESLSGFLHDIRQPLSAINFTAQAQIRLAQMAQRDDALWQRILSSQRSVDEILNSLISRIRSNLKQSASFGVQEITLKQLVEPIVEEYREQIGERRLQIRLQAGQAKVLTDVVAVRRIVRNAVDNAFKHCKQGRILVGCRSTETHVRIQVYDTGPGFENYSKTIASTGTHTGNKVMFDLVRSVGGTVDTQSMRYRNGEYTTGARFELRFPKVTQSLSGAERDNLAGKLQAYRFEGVVIDPLVDENTERLCEHLRNELCPTILHERQVTVFDLIDRGIYPVFVVVILRKSMFGIEHPMREGLRYHGANDIPTVYINVSDEPLPAHEWDQEVVVSRAFNDPDFILRTLRIQTGLSRELLESQTPDAAKAPAVQVRAALAKTSA